MTFGTNIAKALVAAQAEMTDAVKGAKNPFFKSSYADLNSVREAVMPALTKNKCAILQPIVLLESGKSVVRTTILHESGETYVADTEIVCAKVNDPQAYGSAISYARRYGLQSMFNVGAVDDDAEHSMGRKSSKAAGPEVLGTAAAVTTTPTNTTANPNGNGSTVLLPEAKPTKWKTRSKPSTTSEDLV